MIRKLIVIPDLIRNPVFKMFWIPAFAGMTFYFFWGCAFAERSQFTVKATDQTPIFVEFYSAKQEAPLVFLVHMLGSDHRDWNGFTELLNEEGYNVVTFDMRGHGKSIHEKKTWRSFKKSDFLKIVTDMEQIKKYLKDEKTFSTLQIILIGASIGSTLAVKYALQDPQVKGVVALSPGIAYRNINILKDMKHLSIPLFVAAAKGDIYSSQSTQKLVKMYKENKRGIASLEFKLFNVSDHGTALFHKYPELRGEIVSWIKRLLQ